VGGSLLARADTWLSAASSREMVLACTEAMQQRRAEPINWLGTDQIKTV
jgi:hypothetical protein